MLVSSVTTAAVHSTVSQAVTLLSILKPSRLKVKMLGNFLILSAFLIISLICLWGVFSLRGTRFAIFWLFVLLHSSAACFWPAVCDSAHLLALFFAKIKNVRSLTSSSTFKALLLNATLRKKHLCVYKVKQEKITGINRSGVTFFNDINESDIQKTSLKPKCHISQYRPAKFKHVATHMLLPEAARAELWWYQRKKKTLYENESSETELRGPSSAVSLRLLNQCLNCLVPYCLWQ